MSRFLKGSYQLFIILFIAPLLFSCTTEQNMKTARYYSSYGDVCTAGKIYQKEARGGNLEAIYKMGDYHANGVCLDADRDQALLLYIAAAERGYLKGQKKVAEIYYKGEWVEKNYEQALHWYDLAGRQGDAYSQYSVGYMFTYGEGVKKNYDIAARWYAASVRVGSENGKKGLMKLNELGNSVARQEVCTLYKEQKIAATDAIEQQCKGE